MTCSVSCRSEVRSACQEDGPCWPWPRADVSESELPMAGGIRAMPEQETQPCHGGKHLREEAPSCHGYLTEEAQPCRSGGGGTAVRV